MIPSSPIRAAHNDVLYHPWGTVSPAFWAGQSNAAVPPDRPVPEFLRARLDDIASTAASGQITHAGSLAGILDEEITARFGSHIYTVHIREVRAHLALLGRDPVVAMQWYLHTARLRATVQGREHPDTMQATHRAYSLWRSLPDSDTKHRLGAETVAAVGEIHGPAAPLTRRLEEVLARSE